MTVTALHCWTEALQLPRVLLCHSRAGSPPCVRKCVWLGGGGGMGPHEPKLFVPNLALPSHAPTGEPHWPKWAGEGGWEWPQSQCRGSRRHSKTPGPTPPLIWPIDWRSASSLITLSPFHEEGDGSCCNVTLVSNYFSTGTSNLCSRHIGGIFLP